MFFALAIFIAFVSVAGAEESDPLEEAKTHFIAGQKCYNDFDYRCAADEFEKSYNLSHRPDLLFNVARAYAKLYQQTNELPYAEKAILNLTRYTQMAPDAPDREAVDGEIATLQKNLQLRRDNDRAQKEAAAAHAALAQKIAEDALRAKTQKSEPSQSPELAIQERDAQLAHYPRWPGGVLIGIGLAALGTGITTTVIARKDAEVVSNSSGEFADCCATNEQRGKTLAPIGLALNIIGGVLTAVGIITTGVILSRRARIMRAHEHLSLVSTNKNATFGFTF